METLRIISDVHGKMQEYIKLASEVDYSIQIGDLGFAKEYKQLSRLNPDNHKVLGGNHDDYTWEDGEFVNQTPHFLPDFGTHWLKFRHPIFFVRGGYSIDWKYRTPGVDWFPHEEISYSLLQRAIDHYGSSKWGCPNIVVSHECPASLIPHFATLTYFDGELIRPSRTAYALDAMLSLHRPKLWLFGHHHKDVDLTIDGTRFICRRELGHVDFLLEDGKLKLTALSS